MTENDIKGFIGVLSGALFTENEELDQPAKMALLELASTMLVDLHRVADALESIALSLIPKSN